MKIPIPTFAAIPIPTFLQCFMGSLLGSLLGSPRDDAIAFRDTFIPVNLSPQNDAEIVVVLYPFRSDFTHFSTDFTHLGEVNKVPALLIPKISHCLSPVKISQTFL